VINELVRGSIKVFFVNYKEHLLKI